MAFSKDFKGQVKISEVKECFDNLVDGINSQIDIYNASDYVKDIDYNMGGRDLAPLNYTLSIGGLKTFLNAYKNTVVGCKAFRVDNQYVVTDGVMFLQNNCVRIPAQTIPSLPKKLEYSPSLGIYKGQKAPVIGGSGGIVYNSASPTKLQFLPDNYNYLDSSGRIKVVTIEENKDIDEIFPSYFPKFNTDTTVGEELKKSENPSTSGELTLGYSTSSNFKATYASSEQKLSSMKVKLTETEYFQKGNLWFSIPVKDSKGNFYTNALGGQWASCVLNINMTSGMNINSVRARIYGSGGIDESSWTTLSLTRSSTTSYTAKGKFYGGISLDDVYSIDVQIVDVDFNDSGIFESTLEMSAEIAMINTSFEIAVYPDITVNSSGEIIKTKVQATPIYSGQGKSGNIYLVGNNTLPWLCSSVKSSSGAGSSDSSSAEDVDDWIYICDLNPNRDIALANAPHTAMNYVEGFYVTSQSKNVPIRTIEQKDVNKNQFVSGIPADAKGSKRDPRYAIVKLLGEEIARTYQRGPRQAKGYATFDKFFVPKGMESPFTYEGVMNGDPCGQKVFDVNVTRNS